MVLVGCIGRNVVPGVGWIAPTVVLGFRNSGGWCVTAWGVGKMPAYLGFCWVNTVVRGAFSNRDPAAPDFRQCMALCPKAPHVKHFP